MTAQVSAPAVEVAAPALRRPRFGVISRMPIAVRVAVVMLLLVIGSAVFAPLLSPYDPIRQSLRGRLSPPSWLNPNATQVNLAGTDHLGRDVLTRALYGGRVSLTVGFAAVLIGGTIGTLAGLIAGYLGGAVEEIIMTVGDMQLAFPFVLLAIAVIAVLGPSFINLIAVVGISGWVTYARITRGQVLSLREKEFVEAIRALGGGQRRIIFRHILPNTLAPLIVIATLDLARTIILESTLSFLGLGVQPPEPSWGGMLAEGREYLDTAWWICTFPGLILMLCTISVARIGDWLRDILDPTLRNKL